MVTLFVGKYMIMAVTLFQLTSLLDLSSDMDSVDVAL